jgi:hypothetical protein
VTTAKEEALAERERLIAKDAKVPRRSQRMCSNCGATEVRIDALSCCWNPTDWPVGMTG